VLACSWWVCWSMWSGLKVDDVTPDLCMEFTKSQSAQVVIEKLAMVRDDLRAAEHDVPLAPFGAGVRARLANFLFDLSCYISNER